MLIKTSLTPSLFTEMSIPSQASEWSYICVLRISILPVSLIFLLDFGTVPTVWYFIIFFFIDRELLRRCVIMYIHPTYCVIVRDI